MIDGLFNGTNYLAAKKLLDAAVVRHEALAGNLANLETPGYKRVDLAPSFTTQLNQALAAGDPAQISAVTPTVTPDRASGPVTLETELAQLQQNTLNHNLATQLISSRLLRLRLAITGRSV